MTDRAWSSRLYDIRPGNGAGVFLQPQSPYGAIISLELSVAKQQNISAI